MTLHPATIPPNGSSFGANVRIAGDTLAVAAPLGPGTGAIEIFERDLGGPAHGAGGSA